MLNVVATLQQPCGNVLITSESDVVSTSETNVGTTDFWPCHNVVTTLSRRHCVSWVVYAVKKPSGYKFSPGCKKNISGCIFFKSCNGFKYVQAIKNQSIYSAVMALSKISAPDKKIVHIYQIWKTVFRRWLKQTVLFKSVSKDFWNLERRFAQFF